MARDFRKTAWRRAADGFLRLTARLGLGPRNLHVLSVRGRKSGERHSTPVRLVEREGGRYLVGIYGEVSWVRNARAAGEVELGRGGRRERHRVDELPPDEAAPVLRQYVDEVPFVRPWVGLAPDAPEEAFAAESRRRPVFAIRE